LVCPSGRSNLDEKKSTPSLLNNKKYPRRSRQRANQQRDSGKIASFRLAKLSEKTPITSCYFEVRAGA
jgi:hypothetical protein